MSAPLVVNVVPVAGKKWLKVKKGLRVFKTSCSKDCVANVRFTLNMAGKKVTAGGVSQLSPGQSWTTGILLRDSSLTYLRKNYRKSVLKAVAKAVDSETGKRVTKTRYFRFYR